MTKPKSRAKEVKAWGLKWKHNGEILTAGIFDDKIEAIKWSYPNCEVIRVSIKEIK